MNPLKRAGVIAGLTAIGIGIGYYLSSRSTTKTLNAKTPNAKTPNAKKLNAKTPSDPLPCRRYEIPTLNRSDVARVMEDVHDMEGNQTTLIDDPDVAYRLLGVPGTEPNTWNVDLALYKLNELGLRFINLKKWLKAGMKGLLIEITIDELNDAMEELRYQFNQRYEKVKDRLEMMEYDEEFEEGRLLEEIEFDYWS